MSQLQSCFGSASTEGLRFLLRSLVFSTSIFVNYRLNSYTLFYGTPPTFSPFRHFLQEYRDYGGFVSPVISDILWDLNPGQKPVTTRVDFFKVRVSPSSRLTEAPSGVIFDCVFAEKTLERKVIRFPLAIYFGSDRDYSTHLISFAFNHKTAFLDLLYLFFREIEKTCGISMINGAEITPTFQWHQGVLQIVEKFVNLASVQEILRSVAPVAVDSPFLQQEKDSDADSSEGDEKEEDQKKEEEKEEKDEKEDEEEERKERRIDFSKEKDDDSDIEQRCRSESKSKNGTGSGNKNKLKRKHNLEGLEKIAKKKKKKKNRGKSRKNYSEKETGSRVGI